MMSDRSFLRLSLSVAGLMSGLSFALAIVVTDVDRPERGAIVTPSLPVQVAAVAEIVR